MIRYKFLKCPPSKKEKEREIKLVLGTLVPLIREGDSFQFS